MDGVRLNATDVTNKTLYLEPGQRLGVVPCTGGGQPASSATVWIKVDAAPGGGLLATTWALLDLDGRYPTDETETISWAEAPPLPTKFAVTGDAADMSGKGTNQGAPPIFIPPQPMYPPLGNLVPPKPTKTIVFNMNTTKGPNGRANQFTINGISLQPPDDGPSLIELINGPGYEQPVPYTPLPGGAGWNVYDNKLGDVVEIVIRNYSPSRASHPFHTHGHWMLVTSVNGFNTAGFTNTTGDADPVLLARDVVAVAQNTTMTALYIVDNPSAWIVHCHIDWHLIKGLGWIFRDGI